jgi:signal transduction histidine kinase/HAMP domain-containing protein
MVPRAASMMWTRGDGLASGLALSRPTLNHGLTASQPLSITSLLWAVGVFCSAMGALMLVAPHQFDWPAFAWLHDQLTGWGVGFVAAGVGLLVVVILAPKFGLVVLSHLWTGGLLLALAAGFIRTGGWSGAFAYLVLGLGTALAPLYGRLVFRHPWLHVEAMPVLVGFGALLSGVVMLAFPGQFTPSRYDLVRPFLGWFGLAFGAPAVLVCVSQMSRLVPPSIGRVACGLLGSAFLAFAALTAIPNHDWTIFYGGFGAALVLQSILDPRLRRFDPHSLRTRLALVLAAAVAVPLVVLVSVFAHNQESQLVSEQLERQQSVAVALAQDVSDYVNLHHAAVKALAGQPGLLTLSPSQQQAILQASKAAYPDVVSFGTVSADGEPIARADDRTGTSWIGDIVFEEVRRTNQPAVGIRISPVIHRPIFTLGVPILDAGGNFTGMVSSSLESARIATVLGRTDFGPETRTYLVDITGRVIAHPDQNLVAVFADLSAEPSVAAMLANPAPSGALRIAGPRGGVLASYARVAELDWGVIVEQPAAAGLEAIHLKLDLLFGALILLIGAAAGFGTLTARWLSRPLAMLGVAVDGLAAGDSSAPLPAGGLTEVVGLANAFAAMRTRLSVRTIERERAEEALRTSEERFRKQYKGFPLPTCSWLQVGDDFVLQDFNDASEAITGGYIRDWVGWTAAECYAHQPEVLVGLQACVAEQRTITQEMRYRYRATGSDRDLAVSYVFVPPLTVMLHTEDITERKQAEQQRQAMMQSEKLRALGQMASCIAHDLNHSLMLVSSYSDLARQALMEDPPNLVELEDLLTTTTQAALDGGVTVKRLLVFTRAAPEDDSQPVDLSKVVRDAARLTAPRWRDAAQAEGRPISLHIDAEGHPTIQGSPAQLRELMTNVIFNAVDAMPTGGTIRLRVVAEHSQGVIEISDSGEGMSTDIRARMFEPFFTTKGEGGTGLGLAMVFGIVEHHRGHIEVHSVPGSGTTFHISFPLVTASAEAKPSEAPTAELKPLRPLRILAVDDEPMMTRAVVRMLKPSGHLVSVAGSGEDALEKLAEQTFDVVVSDMGMGAGMNGWELADAVKRRWPNVRFLLATGWGAAINPGEARTKGVESILSKPYHPAELLRALASTDTAA